MAKLRTLQDFRDLVSITLVDFRTFFAVELKLLIIESWEKEQQANLKKYYAGRFKKYFLCNPLSVEESKQTGEVAQ